MKAVILYIWRTQGQEAEFICLDAINMTVYMHIFTFITSLSYVCVCASDAIYQFSLWDQ